MAILKDLKTGKLLHLRSTHLFGRNPFKADTLLLNSDASQFHASIRWDGKMWSLVDHSRNGCIVDGLHMKSGSARCLELDMRIQFAPGSDVTWVVQTIDPPCQMLVPLLDESTPIMLQRFHILPSDAMPETSIYVSETGQWVKEDSNGSALLQHGDIIQISGQPWKFVSSPEIETTSDILGYRTTGQQAALFNFIVSQNEEHVSLSIVDGERSANLGERMHHHSLLTLARRRVDDAARAVDGPSQGWVEMEQLSQMLGLDPTYVNLQIFRARTQIARALPGGSNLTNVVERRRGEVRFGTFCIQIARGSNIETMFDPSPPKSAPSYLSAIAPIKSS